jgi:predicted O-methyltransferase YrrM
MPRAELDFVPEYQRYFDEPAGREHYRLLEDLVAHKTGGVAVDVGTLHGASALALSSNPRVQVWSYDIASCMPHDAKVRAVPNISFRIKDGIAAIPDFAGATDLIVLDIDPHDGIQEAAFFDALRSSAFKGTVVCDDIHLNDAMNEWWNSIPEPKEDITAEGHWSGTGLVFFT